LQITSAVESTNQSRKCWVANSERKIPVSRDRARGKHEKVLLKLDFEENVVSRGLDSGVSAQNMVQWWVLGLLCSFETKDRFTISSGPRVCPH
jgi:hypothetical protein